MKVYFEVEVGGPESRYRLTAFAAVAVDHCCESMRRLWTQAVDIGVRGFPKPENLGVFVCIGHLIDHSVPVASIEPVAYCPWCGQAIELLDAAQMPTVDMDW